MLLLVFPAVCFLSGMATGCSAADTPAITIDLPNPPPDNDTDTVTLLAADGVTDTYTLIRSKSYDVETPDDAHTPPEKHIAQTFDATLNKYVFEFYLHLTPDNDRGEDSDRQRNEIKTWDKSPANMIAVKGETHIYRWKFKLPAGFQTSTAFSHIHQLKPVATASSGDEIPVITLTARKKSPDKLQLIYRAPATATASPNTYLKEVNLSDFLDEWVSVEETATYDTPSFYRIKIVRIRDGKTLLEYSDNTLVLFRSDTKFVRPKYGLYRQIKSGDAAIDGLRDETLRFADFELEEKE
jgi:hypothetical protein